MVNRTIANLLNLDGIPLNVSGAQPIKSPKFLIVSRPPTVNDNGPQYIIGTIWIHSDRALAEPYQFWYLADNKLGQPGNYPNATWLRFTTGDHALEQITTTDDGNIAIPVANNFFFTGQNGVSVLTPVNGADTITFQNDGTLGGSFPTDSGTATPSGGVLNIFGSVGAGHTGDNINTTASGDTVVVHLNKSIHQPNTTSDGTQGAYYLGATGSPLAGGTLFMHNYGTRNAFLGSGAGNLTLTTASATDNTGIGNVSLSSIVTAAQNVSVGSGAMQNATIANNCVIVGYNAGNSITTMDAAVCIGSGACQSLDSEPTTDGFVSIGYQSSNLATDISPTTFTPNTVVGGYAMQNCTDGGIGCTAIGQQAFRTFTGTGVNNSINTGVGHAAGQGWVTGTNNSFIGGRSGAISASGTSTANGSQNTALGAWSYGNSSGSLKDNRFI